LNRSSSVQRKGLWHNTRGNNSTAIKNRPDTSAAFFFHSASVYDATLLLIRCITYERLSNRTTSTRGSARSMPRYKHNKNKATSPRIMLRARLAARVLPRRKFLHSLSVDCVLSRHAIARNRAILRLLSGWSCSAPGEKTRSISSL